ncbi:class I SAM-dependent methyltransferase [Pedobacter agri]|uniref:class I SAM-dependent methyltransferase n=1 Tax=Pedobacter agri TaxID=454586 RepID=UPI00292D03E3|nr:class I SAM-dependent methyltransferase [Pedobacter agri]
MDRYKETFETWNKVAIRYQEKFMDLDLYNESYDLICNSIPKKNAKILEIGCGPGNITKYLLSKRPDFDVLGIDIAPNMIKLARKNNPRASFQSMDVRKIDQIKLKFDGIVCGFCLPYLSQSDSLKFIKNCSNLQAAKGIIYISFVEGEPNKSGFQIASNGERSFFYFHHLNDLKEQLTAHKYGDFHVLKVEYRRTVAETEIHTIITAKKK